MPERSWTNKDFNKRVRDTVTDKEGVRIGAEKRKDETVWAYSSGHEVRWEKVEQGDGRRLKEVRQVTHVSSPKTTVGIQYKDGQYEAIFAKEGREPA